MRKSKRLGWLRPIIALSLIGLFIPDAVARAQGGVTCFGRKPTILGTSGGDKLKGTRKSDVIAGMSGNDVISGLGGDDFLCGFKGNDRILGGVGDDEIAGDDDNDSLVGGPGLDYLLGWGGDDSIDGGQGLDIASWWDATTDVTASLLTQTATGRGNDSLENVEGLEGGRGNDSLTGDEKPNWFALGPGDDDLDGAGSLKDYVSFYYSKEGVSVDLTAGSATGEGTDTITGIEGVRGSRHDDTILGDDEDNWIAPELGEDIVDGAGGFADIVDYANSRSPVTVDLAAGTAIGNGTDSLTGFEGVRGTDKDDTITAEDSGDELLGGGGNDVLVGGEGLDNLIGDAGDDTLLGGGGDDGLFGLEGDDSLDGGSGFDFLSGGYGEDRCLNGEDLLGCEDMTRESTHHVSQW